MSPRLTFVTVARVLRQLTRDHRTLGLLLVVPVVLMCLLAWIYADGVLFEQVGPVLLTVFPFVVMFVVTSVATLRERTSGTLERLLTTPLGKADLVLGYALAFGLLAVVQGAVVTAVSVWLLGLDTAATSAWLVLVVVASGVLGTSLGLLASAFAATEFQAVQLMPATVLPQFLLCGLLVPRDQLPRAARARLRRAAAVLRRRRGDLGRAAARPGRRPRHPAARHRRLDRRGTRPREPHPAPPDRVSAGP